MVFVSLIGTVFDYESRRNQINSYVSAVQDNTYGPTMPFKLGVFGGWDAGVEPTSFSEENANQR